jgi:hypothetical protein
MGFIFGVELNESMNGPPGQANEELAYQRAIEKYKELYSYSTDILVKEHERFNRADEKASKYGTTFIFLIGAIGFFDKAVLEEMLPPHGIIEWALLVLGVGGLIFSLWGWYEASSVIRLYPYVSRRLDEDMLSFFRKETLLNVYYALAKENSEAYQENLGFAQIKHERLIKVAGRLRISVLILVAVAILYGVHRYLVAICCR